jgi:hypothetical protein
MSRAIPSLVISLSLVCVGCAERQAQVAVQGSLTGLAHGVHTASELIAERMPTAAEAARQAMLAERRSCAEASESEECPPQDDMEAWMENYEERLSVWNDGITALRAVQETLLVGQAALTAWVEHGSLPASWGTFCGSIEDGVQGVLSMLEAVGVDVPDALQGAFGFASEACELAGPWFQGMVEGD